MAENSAKTDAFLWEGKDSKGNKTKGVLQGRNPTMVKAELRRRGIQPLRVKKKSPPLFGGFGQGVKSADIALFSRQMSAMVNASVPIVQALDIIAGGFDKPVMRDLILAIKTDVEGGTALATALAKYPEYFDELYCNLVNVGEQSGSLDHVLQNIADYRERIEEIKSKVRNAMLYPAAVISVAIFITVVLMIVVVPAFESLFAGFNAELPLVTQIVIEISRFLRDWWLVLLGGLVLGIYLLVRSYKRVPAFRHRVSRWILRVPVFGAIFVKSIIARFARTLATMFGAGVPLVDAMTSVSGAVGNETYAKAVLDIRDQIATGQQLNNAMRWSQLFPNMVTQMVAIGEESGSLDDMLTRVAVLYEKEVKDSVDGLSSLLEPFVMVILGVLIGGLVAAMYLPIFQMGSVISG